MILTRYWIIIKLKISARIGMSYLNSSKHFHSNKIVTLTRYGNKLNISVICDNNLNIMILTQYGNKLYISAQIGNKLPESLNTTWG